MKFPNSSPAKSSVTPVLQDHDFLGDSMQCLLGSRFSALQTQRSSVYSSHPKRHVWPRGFRYGTILEFGLEGPCHTWFRSPDSILTIYSPIIQPLVPRPGNVEPGHSGQTTFGIEHLLVLFRLISLDDDMPKEGSS